MTASQVKNPRNLNSIIGIILYQAWRILWDAGPAPHQQNFRREVDLKVDDIMISIFNGFSCWTHSVSGCQVVLGWLASGWYSQKLEDGFGCMIESILWMQMWSNWQARRLAKHTFLSPYFCWYLLIGFENPCRWVCFTSFSIGSTMFHHTSSRVTRLIEVRFSFWAFCGSSSGHRITSENLEPKNHPIEKE